MLQNLRFVYSLFKIKYMLHAKRHVQSKYLNLIFFP